MGIACDKPSKHVHAGKGVGKKFSRRGGGGEELRKKIPKISKIYQKIAQYYLPLPEGEGGNGKKDRKIAKKAEK